MKKLISVILLLCMLLATFVSCAGEKEPPKETEENQETKEPNYLDTLPAKDLDGKTFRFLISSQHETFYMQDQESANRVDSACFARNRNIEDRYNVDIVYTPMDGNASGSAEFQSTVLNSRQLDAKDAFDLVIGQNYYCLPLFSQGVYHNLRESTVIDFDADWAHKMINDNGTVNGKLYGASGSIVISQLTHALAMYYNKNIFNSYGFAEQYDLYQLVRDGKWTFEVFYEIVTSFDNVNEEAENAVYGFETFYHAAVGLHCGFKNDPIVKNAEGVYSTENYYGIHLEDIYSKIRSLYNDHAGVASEEDLQRLTNGNSANRMDHLLFSMNYLHGLVEAPMYQKAENRPLGVLPSPKYDEAQTEYYTRIMRGDLYYIPQNVDLATSALMVEALNYETFRLVYPEYWDKVIELRSADTSEDREMIQILAATVHSSFAEYFTFALSDIHQQVAIEALKNSSSMSVWWGQNEKIVNKKLTKLIEQFK